MNPLVASIAANPELHQVNREEKMKRSVAAINKNIELKRAELNAARYIRESTGDIGLDNEAYGYGNKRIQGD